MYFQFYYWFLDSWARARACALSSLPSVKPNTKHRKDNGCVSACALSRVRDWTLHANNKCKNPIFALLLKRCRFGSFSRYVMCNVCVCKCYGLFFPLHSQMFHYVHASLLLIQTFAFLFAMFYFIVLFPLWTFFSTKFASFCLH